MGGCSGPRATETSRESIRKVDQSGDSFAAATIRANMATQTQHNNRAHRAHYRVVLITVVATLGLAVLGHDTPARVFAGWGLTAATVLAILLTYRPVLRSFPGTRNARRGGRDRGTA